MSAYPTEEPVQQGHIAAGTPGQEKPFDDERLEAAFERAERVRSKSECI